MTGEQVMVTQTAEQVGKAIAAAEKAGRRYQHQQDVEFLTEYFSWLCLTQPWDKAGTVWQTFVNLMSEGE